MAVNDQLRDLFSPEQLRQLDTVRAHLKDNPKALDTHERGEIADAKVD